MTRVVVQPLGFIASALVAAAVAVPLAWASGGPVASRVHGTARVVVAPHAVSVAERSATLSATAKRTTACLTSKRVLTTAGSPREGAYLMPKRLPGLGALPGTALVRFSMALHSSFALDNGTLLFERNDAMALRVYKALLAVNLASARAVRGGVDLAKARTQIKSMLRLSGNVVIAWRSYPVKAAARALIAGCLR